MIDGELWFSGLPVCMRAKLMRMKLYNALVNRHSGIKERYHRYRQGGGTVRKWFSYLYLLGLNLLYYLFRRKDLALTEQARFYEEKKLPCGQSESAEACRELAGPAEFARRLGQYEVVSFDLFDTLIFRPFSEPADVFHHMGLRLGIMDFKRIRMEQEVLARKRKFEEAGHYEVTLGEIWQQMERETGIAAEYGMGLETELERKFCYANPYMKEVFQSLAARSSEGPKLIVVSDMYMPSDFLLRLLEENGYTGIEKLYVSCEYRAGKANGELYKTVKEEYKGLSIAHVGDNSHSDVKMAEKAGIKAFYYPNVNRKARDYRAYDMSPVIGGAYRGIVDNHIYSGLYRHSREYEYGYIYGGLFAVGYCRFIHEYCVKNQVDRLLFLSRDGDILKKVYDRLYAGEDTDYVYWSRAAAAKLMAEYNRYDYFRRFIYHKVNQGKKISEILSAMELDGFAELLDAWRQDTDSQTAASEVRSCDCLTDKNADALKGFLQEHFDRVLDCYERQRRGAELYYRKRLTGCRKAVAVDIGWAGSGAVSLAYLAERVWKLPCGITGIVAGTNTIHNAEPEAGEIFLQSEKLIAYLFSQGYNRDVMKKHDPDRDYNVFWELLLSSPTRHFVGFDVDEDGVEAVCRFGGEDGNQQGIREIQQGILDFAEEYRRHFADFPYMLHISGRDACAPMLAAAGGNEKYLREIKALFDMEVDVN